MNLLSKKEPYDLNAEYAVIGSILLDSSNVEVATSILKPEDFYNENNRSVFQTLISMKHKEEQVDFVLLKAELNRILTTDEVDWNKLITKAYDSVGTSVRIKEYAKIVLEKSMLRKLMKIAKEVLEMSFENKTIEEIEAETSKFHDVFNNTLTELQFDTSEDIFKDILSDLNNGSGKDFIKSNYKTIDYLIGGFERGKYTVVGARPSMGKTAFAIAMGMSVAKNEDVKILFFSLEMTKKQLIKRMMSSYFGIDGTSFITGLSEQEKEKIKNGYQKFMEQINRMTIFDEKAYTINEIKNIIKNYRKTNGRVDMIIIDYISLIKTDRKFQSRNYELESISQELKQISKMFNCHVLTLQQLNRAGDVGPESMPRLSHLKDSGSIEQDVDIAMLLHRKDYENRSDNNDDTLEVLIAKNRDGATGVLKFIFDKKTQKISEIF